MTDERSPASALKGRLAEVYVPALVSGTIDALTRRLGNRATIDDPLYGRASSLASIEPLLTRVAEYFAEGSATYEHVCSTTGVDRDIAEGRLALTLDGEAREMPIAVVAERRRLREIELRIYYAPEGLQGRKARAPLMPTGPQIGLATSIEEIIEGVRKGAIEQALAGFEDSGRIVDATGRSYTKHLGLMGLFLSKLGDVDIQIGGIADDGRTACIEGTVLRNGSETGPALLAFERGESGLVSELRVYSD